MPLSSQLRRRPPSPPLPGVTNAGCTSFNPASTTVVDAAAAAAAAPPAAAPRLELRPLSCGQSVGDMVPTTAEMALSPSSVFRLGRFPRTARARAPSVMDPLGLLPGTRPPPPPPESSPPPPLGPFPPVIFPSPLKIFDLRLVPPPLLPPPDAPLLLVLKAESTGLTQIDSPPSAVATLSAMLRCSPEAEALDEPAEDGESPGVYIMCALSAYGATPGHCPAAPPAPAPAPAPPQGAPRMPNPPCSTPPPPLPPRISPGQPRLLLPPKATTTVSDARRLLLPLPFLLDTFFRQGPLELRR